jgi:hypothetical protein
MLTAIQKVALTDAQREMIRRAASALHWVERDKFNLDLASAFARCRHPLTDTDLRVCIRQLLGVGNR